MCVLTRDCSKKGVLGLIRNSELMTQELENRYLPTHLVSAPEL